MRKFFAAAIALVALAGCSYNAQAPVKPALDVYNNFNNRVPGKFALFVDGSDLNGAVRVRGEACRLNNYPMAVGSAFEQSAYRTLEQLVEGIERVEIPLDGAALSARGLTGQITVRGVDPDMAILVTPSFLNATVEGDVEISANVEVFKATGRVFGSTVNGRATTTIPFGGCGTGADAASEAAGEAIRKLMRQMGERLSNAPELRR